MIGRRHVRLLQDEQPEEVLFGGVISSSGGGSGFSTGREPEVERVADGLQVLGWALLGFLVRPGFTGYLGKLRSGIACQVLEGLRQR